MRWWFNSFVFWQLFCFLPSVVVGFTFTYISDIRDIRKQQCHSINSKPQAQNGGYNERLDKDISFSKFKFLLFAQETDSNMDPEPLATEGDWAAYLDGGNTGLVYYFNSITGESLWEPPTETFPEIVFVEEEDESKSLFGSFSVSNLFKKTTELEKELDDVIPIEQEEMLEYEEEEAEEEEEVEEMVLIEEELVEEELVEEEPKKSTPGLFSNIFAKSKSAPAKEVEVEEEVDVKEELAVVDEIEPDVESPKPSPMFPTFKNPFLSTTKEKAAPIATKIQIAQRVMPHPQKVSWGGEDAVFVQGRTFGVFDGVSSADKIKGLPLYSTTLAKQMTQLVRDENDAVVGSKIRSEGLTIPKITSLMQCAVEYADDNATGASTAIVASIGEDNRLRALNIGDSALIVIRNSKVLSRSKDIIHYFDCPYQFAVDSPDRPREGTKMNVQLLSGDVIVAASDGIFDNLDNQAIIDVVEKNAKKTSLIANALSSEARRVSLDKNAETPYAKEAKKNRIKNYESGLGGKVDDISCVVVQIP